jgi:cytoskeletal protein CcmA (bactofilin family)
VAHPLKTYGWSTAESSPGFTFPVHIRVRQFIQFFHSFLRIDPSAAVQKTAKSCACAPLGTPICLCDSRGPYFKLSERISVMVMWKQHPSSSPASSLPDQVRPSVPVVEPAPVYAGPPSSSSFKQSGAEQTVLTSGIFVRGEISGPEALYIDGIVDGQINTPGERVTVGPKGTVMSSSKTPCITAREIVVLGTVRGNLVATDRLEIRANGSVTGDVSTMRLKIEDGSFFQGGIDIRKAEPKPAEPKPVEEVEQAQVSPSDLEYAAAEI